MSQYRVLQIPGNTLDAQGTVVEMAELGLRPEPHLSDFRPSAKGLFSPFGDGMYARGESLTLTGSVCQTQEPHIGSGTAYDLSQAAEAHRDIESRKTEGKLYLIAPREPS